MKDITKEEAQELREMARLAFRNSVGATEDDAVTFNHKDYSTLDLNFLWHFAELVAAHEREWVELTDDEIEQWVDALPYDPDELHLTRFAREVIAAFKEKNK